MTEELQISLTDEGSFHVLRVGGRLLSTGFTMVSDSLRAVLVTPPQSPGRYLVLDLSAVTMLTSSCIDAICSQRSLLSDDGWRMALVTLRDEHRELFEITGLNGLFPVYASLNSFTHDRIGHDNDLPQ